MLDTLNNKLINWVGFEQFYGITMKSTYVLFGLVFIYFTYQFWFTAITEIGTNAGSLLFSFLLYAAIVIFLGPLLMWLFCAIGMWLAITFRLIQGIYRKICP